MIDLEKLKELRAKATPGPWELETTDLYYDKDDVAHAKKKGITAKVGDVMSTHITGISVFGIDHNHWLGWHISGEDADFQLAVIAPELADEVLRLTAERDAAVAAREKLAAENVQINSKISEISDGLADFIEELMRALPELRPFRARLADSVSALRAYAKGDDK
jgi:hypothetical protein